MAEAGAAVAPADRLEMQLEASASGLAVALAAVEAFLDRHAVTERARWQVPLLLEEAVMNVAMHAHDDAARHRMTMTLTLLAATIELRLEDDGKAFDPHEVPAPARPASLDEARPGGLGVHLLRTFAAALHYERRDGRNLLTLRLAR